MKVPEVIWSFCEFASVYTLIAPPGCPDDEADASPKVEEERKVAPPEDLYPEEKED